MQTSFTLTTRHTDILLLLYRFRFLSRSQIQHALNHKYHHRVTQWLHDLIDNKFVQLHTNLPIPVYSLGINGRHYLKGKDGIDISVLNKVWRDTQYSHNFQKQCLYLADIFLSLNKSTQEHNEVLDFLTKAEMKGTEGLISPAPDAYIAIESQNGEIRRHFLEILDNNPPRIIRRRVRQFFDYYLSDEWQESTSKPFPEVILICPNDRLKSHLRFFIKGMIEDEPDISFYLASKDQVAKRGMIRAILERVIYTP